MKWGKELGSSDDFYTHTYCVPALFVFVFVTTVMYENGIIDKKNAYENEKREIQRKNNTTTQANTMHWSGTAYHLDDGMTALTHCLQYDNY